MLRLDSFYVSFRNFIVNAPQGNQHCVWNGSLFLHNLCVMKVKSRIMIQCNNKSFLKVSFKHFPKQRRLNEETRSETEKLLKMKCNKKVLRSHVQNFSGKVITSCDINNMRAKVLISKSDKNDIEKLIKKLRENKG